VWSKPNGLPESVTDRVRRAHEQWFHLVKQPRYFSALDEIREPYDPATSKRYAAGYNPRTIDSQRLTVNTKLGDQLYDQNPLGKLPGSVWEIPSEPLIVPAELGVDHFAAFPTAWPKRLILGWSPSGICTECGEGRMPVATKHHERPAGDWNPQRAIENRPVSHARPSSEVTIDGYACACPKPTARTTPAVVLDPFGGTGTTALVARALGRIGISVDLSHDYCRLASWRTTDRAQLAKVLGRPKPPPVLPDQLDMFGEASA